MSTEPDVPRRADVPRRPGRPATLSREKIVDAVASFDDVDAMTMRELAARLNVRHGALYRWVSTRDELFDLVSDVVVDRVLASPMPDAQDWRPRLRHLAWAMHDEFLAVPGYASHLARPHRHNAHSVDRLRDAAVGAFTDAGVDGDVARQSWYVAVTSIVGWLAREERPPGLGHEPPGFDVFLGVLLRGLPARALEPGDA